MDRHKLLSADYLDILFDGRNKAYGGYDLRRRYGAHARKATVTVLLGAVLATALPVIASSLRTTRSAVIPDVSRVHELKDVPAYSQPRPVIPPIQEPPAVAPTIKSPVLKVVQDQEVAEPPKTVDEIAGKVIGLNDNPGTPDGLMADLGQPTGKGTEVIEHPAEPEKPFVIVDVPPVFNGDLSYFLEHHLRYPEAAREDGREGMVGIQFVVNEDGSISDVEVIRSAHALLDAEALRVVRSMPAWKPGKVGGKPVKAYFKLPITFELN